MSPDAGLDDLRRLRRRRKRYSRFERRSPERSDACFDGGLRYLTEHPELGTGLIVTMRIGPWHLLGETLARAGLDPLAPRGPELWRQVAAGIRAGRPVIVCLDAFDDVGAEEMPYRLPGRELRLRRGIGGLIHRLGCPVHTVVLRWDDAGGVVWRQGLAQPWHLIADVEAVSRLLFDWGFAEVLATPEQWQRWELLAESYECFAAIDNGRRGPPPVIVRDLTSALDGFLARRADAVCVDLVREVAVWPGDVLADLTGDRFFTAEGMRAGEIDLLRDRSPTLAEIVAAHGRPWARFHLLRLWLLEMVTLRGVQSSS